MQNREFGAVVGKLINRQDLSYEEAEEAFTAVLENKTSELQQGAFLAALTAKGETKEEVAGGWKAVYSLDTVKADFPENAGLVDNCGTGMDSFKTFNISTAASLIAAACGVRMARHGARAISSVCGTVDMAEALGVDVECGADLVTKSIMEAGIGLYNGMSPQIHPSALGRILGGIHFGTTLNISASLANPALPKLGVRGVYNRRMLTPVAEIMKQIGYRRALVLHGTIEGSELGMDEASVCGRTFIRELHEDGSFTDYSFVPEDFGLTLSSAQDLTPGKNINDAALDFARIISGRGNRAGTDAVILNAALVLYVSGRSDSVGEGVEAARKAVKCGGAVDVLRNWVAVQNRYPETGKARLDSILMDAAVC